MSPEQMLGQSVDRRTDLFSLGCILYELTLGSPPFQRRNDLDAVQCLLQNRYTPAHQVDPDYPKQLDAILMRALAPSVSDRYSSAEEMKHALEQWLEKNRTEESLDLIDWTKRRFGALSLTPPPHGSTHLSTRSTALLEHSPKQNKSWNLFWGLGIAWAIWMIWTAVALAEQFASATLLSAHRPTTEIISSRSEMFHTGVSSKH